MAEEDWTVSHVGSSKRVHDEFRFCMSKDFKKALPTFDTEPTYIVVLKAQLLTDYYHDYGFLKRQRLRCQPYKV